MAFVLQHALTQGVIRRRAPLSSQVAQVDRDALEEGDWLTIRSDDGLYEPVAQGAPVDRLAWPIVVEPSQPDVLEAGLAVVHGDYFAQTDRFAPIPLFTAYSGTNVPAAARVAVDPYAKGVALVAFGFGPAAGAVLAGPVVSGLSTALTSGAEDAFVVAYVERTETDNPSGLLQIVVF